MSSNKCPHCGALAPLPPEVRCSYCGYCWVVPGTVPSGEVLHELPLAWILERAWARLRGLSEVHIHPNIPRDLRSSALRSYGGFVSQDEPVAVLIDFSTPLFDAEGTLLTTRRLCWRFTHNPNSVVWRNLLPEQIHLSERSVAVYGSLVFAGEKRVAEGYYRLLKDIACHARGLSLDAETAPKKRTEEELFQLFQSCVGIVPDLYYFPQLPPEKEASVREVYRSIIGPNERILAIYDATLFGSAEEGFVLTPTMLCWKNSWDAPLYKDLSGVVSAGVILCREGSLSIGGRGLDHAGGCAAGLVRFLQAIALY